MSNATRTIWVLGLSGLIGALLVALLMGLRI
jgi:hypothetical protein